MHCCVRMGNGGSGSSRPHQQARKPLIKTDIGPCETRMISVEHMVPQLEGSWHTYMHTEQTMQEEHTLGTRAEITAQLTHITETTAALCKGLG